MFRVLLLPSLRFVEACCPDYKAGALAQAGDRLLLTGPTLLSHPSPRVRAATDTMSDYFFNRFQLREDHASILHCARTDPQRITNIVISLEDSRKKGFCAFFEMLRGRVWDWQRDGIRRADLTATHREVQNNPFVASTCVYFLKMIQFGYEAMIAKWGPASEVLGAQMDTLSAMITELEAYADPTQVEALKSALAALKAQVPEQESEPCVICTEPVVASQVFDEGQGIIFPHQCMHAMHMECFRGYVNVRPNGHMPWGAEGVPFEGKKIPCPSCRDNSFYTKQYVEDFSRARDMGRKEKTEAAARKRNAEAMAATDADPNTEVLEGEGPEGEEQSAVPRLALTDKPDFIPGSTPEQVQDWIERKVAAGHFRYLEARHKKSGVLYQFVIDGSEDVYPRKKAIKMVCPMIHDPTGKYGAKDNFNIINPKNGKEMFARGRLLPGGAAQSSAAGSSA